MRHGVRAALAAAIGSAVLGIAGPAGAELEWVPEGRFLGRYSFPIGAAGRSGSDTNFDLVSGRLGTRLLIAPGISLRAVGEVLSLDRSRRAGDLQLGYAQWQTDVIGVLRLGQVPAFRDIEEQAIGDPMLGPGAATAAGFFYPSGLGVSWTQDFNLDFASTSVDVIGMYSEGLLGSGALAPNPLYAEFPGTGPGLLAHGALGFPGGLTAHLFGRYGALIDQQAAVALTQPAGDFDFFVSAAASSSNPQVLSTATGSAGTLVSLPTATDLAAMARVRYNLGGLAAALSRGDLIGRIQAIARNVTNVATLEPSFPIPVSRTDLLSTLAAQYRITDYTTVALDLTENRTVSPAASSSLFFGVRAGVQF